MTSDTNKKVLMLHSGALGDCVLLARFIAAALPQAELAVACSGEKVKLLTELGAAKSGFDLNGTYSAILDYIFAPDIKKITNIQTGKFFECFKNFDTVISAIGFNDTAARDRLKKITNDCRFVNPRPEQDGQKHIWDIWQQQCNLSPAMPQRNTWDVPAKLRQQAAEKLSALNLPTENFICIHPGSGSVKKCWPVENFAELVKSVSAPCVFLCGEVEAERFRADDFRILENAAPVIMPSSLTELAVIISLARHFIGNDSGPAHLAAALGVSATVLFANEASSAELFHPPATNSASVTTLVKNTMAEIKIHEILATLNNECNSHN